MISIKEINQLNGLTFLEWKYSNIIKMEAIEWCKFWNEEINKIDKSKDKKYLIKHRFQDKLKLSNRIIALVDFVGLNKEEIEFVNQEKSD